jgi:hypothetical protein
MYDFELEDLMSLEEPQVSKDALRRISRDMRNAAKKLGVREARYLVDSYYELQGFRVASGNQFKALSKGEEPSEAINWLNVQFEAIEARLRSMLDSWSSAQPMGAWARQITGIGPVIAAGLCAHIDITRAPTAGHIWRYAGLDPSKKWEKGAKRPWNASLKRLCWIIGESFVKVSGHKKDFYGKKYLERKAYEAEKNEAGDYAALAKMALERMKRREAKDLVAKLEAGKLPQAALHARSKRWTVKLFLSHWHAAAYRQYYGTEPPLPYPIAHLGHVHVIPEPELKSA